MGTGIIAGKMNVDIEEVFDSEDISLESVKMAKEKKKDKSRHKNTSNHGGLDQSESLSSMSEGEINMLDLVMDTADMKSLNTLHKMKTIRKKASILVRESRNRPPENVF